MPRKKNENRRVSFYLTPQLDIKLKALLESRGDTYDSETIKEAIRFMHEKKFPLYAVSRSDEDAPVAKTAKIKAQVTNRDERKKAKKEMQHENQVAICAMLEGEISGTYCKYYTYDGRNRFLQETPLTLLNEEIVGRQYLPSREKVEKLQAEGKVNY